ncbi:hypothetical protein [Paenibacillus polymyxa]|uniref:hypothetical protein n=1 Tax=Paenibacillus polymyxa TaxID=1406 RepID=UPI000737B718|nr:hypothetical protein [Paenibacillus polymyxa]
MRVYTFEVHINNIDLLKKYKNSSEKQSNADDMFKLVNELANFIQDNEQYSSIPVFNDFTESIVEIIDFCNGYFFNLDEFKRMHYNISLLLSQLVDQIIKNYPYKIYFKGKDKYGVVNNIIKEKVNFIMGIPDSSIKKNIFNKQFDILILSEETAIEEDSHNHFDGIIYYDNLMNELFSLSQEIYDLTYDYSYLLNAISKAKKTENEAIVVGSSYSMYGINESTFSSNIVNLSLPSQDIYYSILIAKEVIDNNDNIKKCYLGTGYWTFYFDLSKSINSAITRVENVYYPLFRDSNNYKYENKKKIPNLNMIDNLIIKEIFDLNFLYKILSNIIFQSNEGTYFNSKMKREDFREILPHRLDELSVERKFELGKDRANQHNKLIKYKETREDSKRMIFNFVSYLCEKNIELVVLNFPATPYYYSSLNKEFIEDFYAIINEMKLKGNFKFLDLAAVGLFVESDFVDIDHLSDSGALKVNDLIKQHLK